MDYWMALLYLALAICLGSHALHVAIVRVLLYVTDIFVCMWWWKLGGTNAHRIPNVLLIVRSLPRLHKLINLFSCLLFNGASPMLNWKRMYLTSFWKHMYFSKSGFGPQLGWFSLGPFGSWSLGCFHYAPTWFNSAFISADGIGWNLILMVLPSWSIKVMYCQGWKLT